MHQVWSDVAACRPDMQGANRARRCYADERSPLQFGGIIGSAVLVDVLSPCITAADDVWCRCGHPWHMGEHVGWQLTDMKPLPFRPLKGRLGFFRVDS
jgi:hypothetical protein